MEVERLCYNAALLQRIICSSVLDTFLAAQKSLLLLSGALRSDINIFLPLSTDERFSSGGCKKSEEPTDASETDSDRNDDDVDNDDDNDQDDDYSGEESEGFLDSDKESNGNKSNGASGSDDDDDSDDDDGDDDGDDSDDDDDDEDEEDFDDDGAEPLKKKK